MTPQRFLVLISSIAISLTLMAECRNTEFFHLCLQSSFNMHNGMFWRAMRAPLSFFEVRPVGTILARFTNDLDTIDQDLPYAMLEVITVSFPCLDTLTMSYNHSYDYFQQMFWFQSCTSSKQVSFFSHLTDCSWAGWHHPDDIFICSCYAATFHLAHRHTLLHLLRFPQDNTAIDEVTWCLQCACFLPGIILHGRASYHKDIWN